MHLRQRTRCIVTMLLQQSRMRNGWQLVQWMVWHIADISRWVLKLAVNKWLRPAMHTAARPAQQQCSEHKVLLHDMCAVILLL
jgi:hypothetical protein